MRPKIEMTDEKVALLMRSALVEEAFNVNERFAAVTAGIRMDDDVIPGTPDAGCPATAMARSGLDHAGAFLVSWISI